MITRERLYTLLDQWHRGGTEAQLKAIWPLIEGIAATLDEADALLARTICQRKDCETCQTARAYLARREGK